MRVVFTSLLFGVCLLAGCQTGVVLVSEPVNTVRLGRVDFLVQSLMVGESSSAVAAADLDNDGHLDLVVADDAGYVTIFRGDGSGGMTNLGRVAAGEQPNDLALADIDSDGGIEIVVANHDTDYLTILTDDGAGRFQEAANSPLRINVRPHPHVVMAADLDDDGHMDLIVDDRDGQGVHILRGTGAGTFHSSGVPVDVGGDPYLGLALGDIDNDGDLDLVTPNPREVGVVRNIDPEHLTFSVLASLPAPGPFAVELADLNGDGNLDIVTALNEGSSLVQVFLGDGSGRFLEWHESPFRAGLGGKRIVRGDFDGNNIQDVAVASFQSSEVLLLLGGPDAFYIGQVAGGDHPWGMVAADLNEDQQDDLVIADSANPRAIVYLSRGDG